MGKEQLLAEILRLPPEERKGLIHQAIDSLPMEYIIDPSMTPGVRAELERRYQDMLDHPEDEMTWEEACKELDQRRVKRRKKRSA